MSGYSGDVLCLLRSWRLRRLAGDSPGALAQAIEQLRSPIPVLLIAYNNGVYVQSMVRQLAALGITPVILDNCSSDAQTRQTLSQMASQGQAHVVQLRHNFGHKVAFLPPFYEQLPDVFACSDPDLQFNPRMPADFLDQLQELTRRYGVYKAGLALDVPQDLEVIPASYRKRKCRPFPFFRQYTVREWEARFWRKPLAHPALEVYAAPVDTTMAVYDKRLYDGDFFDAVRVAGDFKCLHLPWHPELDLFDAQRRRSYQQGNRSSSWLKQ